MTLTHVAFETERAWADDARALSGDAEVLARWWTWREARLAAALVTMTDPAREALGLELADLVVGPIPAVVRRVARDRVHDQARRLRALTALNAPAVILANVRNQILRHAAMLDPARPWVAEPTPELIDGDLHVWLEQMLRAAHADAPDLGLGAAFDATPEAQAFHARAVEAPRPPLADGGEHTTFAMWPDLAAYASPRIALAHRIELPDGRLVVTESGGPVFVELAGDRAKVSFVWLETDPAGPWRPI